MSEIGTYFGSVEIARESSTSLLGKGFTLTQVISDYLRLMSALIMSTLQRRFRRHDVSMNDVEWCVALAHDWGDHAMELMRTSMELMRTSMELMRTSMERAGLVQSAISRGGSPYPLRFVPELDAASYHCLRGILGDVWSRIQVGDKLLVADLGLKSCYITVQEVHSAQRSKFEVKQVAESVWVLDGRKQWDKMLIHRDIKSENILLSRDMVAKVADFGISRLTGGDEADKKWGSHLTTRVMGSLGYLDPEYYETWRLKHSSDVYSFGIVLLEMITCRKTDPNPDDASCCIGVWVKRKYGRGGSGAMKAVVDSSLSGNYNPKAMKLVIKLAISCINHGGGSRPKMSEVVCVLQKALIMELEEKSLGFLFFRSRILAWYHNAIIELEV